MKPKKPEQLSTGEVLLTPITDDPEIFEEIEKHLALVLKRELYLPLLKIVSPHVSTIKNSTDDLLYAIQSGRITFDRGVFTGKFDAKISRELKKLGATWDRKKGVWKIPKAALTIEMQNAIAASESKFDQMISKLDQTLKDLIPEKIADQISVNKFFDAAMWRFNKKLSKQAEKIRVLPQLSDEQKKVFTERYAENTKRDIKNWTENKILELREQIRRRTFEGYRYDGLVKSIQKSYGTTLNKAKFLARQETHLAMAEFKRQQFNDAGSDEYIWETVVGSPDHPVRDAHKKLAGKRFRWSNPPITSEPGEPVRRNNPGEDFNCRCYARPIVRF